MAFGKLYQSEPPGLGALEFGICFQLTLLGRFVNSDGPSHDSDKRKRRVGMSKFHRGSREEVEDVLCIKGMITLS